MVNKKSNKMVMNPRGMTFERPNILMFVLVIVLIISFSGGVFAATINAISCEQVDVQAAIDSAVDGDTILVPAGSCNWTSILIITRAIKLVGSGIDSTTIINDIVNTGAGDFLIAIIPSVPADNPYIEVTGFTFDANSEGGCIRVNCEDNIYAYDNFRIHHNKMKNTLDIGDSYMSVRIKGDCFGLIDNNQFVNNRYDFKIYGDDQNSWDNYPGLVNLGTKNYLYIEDNNSTSNNYYVLTSGEGARWVFRYNNVDISVTQAVLDAHGNTNNDGVVAHEVYENTFIDSARLHDFRGGVGVIYNNNVNRLGSSGSGVIQVREEDCYQSGIDCVYPGIDPITNSYLWNNIDTYTNNSFIIREADNQTANMIEENRDYWTNMNVIDYYNWASIDHPNPDNEFIFGLAANHPSACLDDDVYWETDTRKLYRCDGDNNWIFVYEPYTYPHPLTFTGDCGNSICDVSECYTCPSDCSLADCCGIEGCNSGVGETCSNCVADCPTSAGEVCCLGTLYVGDCCDDGDCTSLQICNNHVCSEPLGVCDGLNLLMHFDEDSSIVIDDSGNGNDGTVNGATFTPSGKFSGAFDYDGLEDYIALPISYGQSSISETTVCAWVKSLSSSDQLISSFDRSEVWRLALKDDGGYNVGWDTTDSTDLTDDLITTVNYADGSWHNICGWFEAGASPDKKIFVDGVQVDSTTAHGGNNLGAGVERAQTYGFIGTGSEADLFDGTQGPTDYFNGTIDEVAVWNRSLSATEILDLYNSGAPITCGVISSCGPADTDSDGVVSIIEVMNYITEWKAGNVNIVDLMTGITEWKNGC